MLTTADPGAGDSGMTEDIFFERLRTRIDRGLSAEPEIDAQLLEQIGRIYYTHGRYEEAAGILRRAVGVRQTIPGSGRSAAMGSALHLLGTVLTEAGAHEEANNVLRAALSIRLELYGDRDLRVAGVLDNLTLLDTWRGDYGQAREWFDRSEWIYSQNLADYDLHMLSQSNSVASIMIERGDLDEARAVHGEALERVRERLGEGDEYVVGLLLVDAKIRRGLGDLEGSRAAHEELLARLARLHGERDHPDVAAACASAAETLSLLGEHARAIRLFDRALGMQRLLHGENHPITARTAQGLEAALRRADG